MAKTSMKNLVSLIMEQINVRGELNQLFPPDQFVLIDNPLKYPELFDTVEDTESSDTEIPQPELQAEPEMAQAAEMNLNEAREFEYEKEELQEAMRIPADVLTLGPRTPDMPKIACVDPETNEVVPDVVIGNLILTTPSGKKLLVFYNQEIDQKVDRSSTKAWYVVLPEENVEQKYHNRLFTDKPRGNYWGKHIERDPQGKLEKEIERTEDPEEREKLERRLKVIRERNAKFYGIFPMVNAMFSNPDVLDHLDKTLVPETWATSIRTEHTTNKVLLKKFGGESAEIDADFISVRDLSDVDSAINDVMELRAELAMGDTVSDREREASRPIPRQHANYIYHGGNWHAKQRVHDKDFFQREGGKTPVYQLLSKNIQEGDKKITVKSVLELKGKIENDEYVLTAKFSATLSARNPERGAGEEVDDLFKPITVGLRKPLLDKEGNPIDPDTFTLETNTNFFVDEGRKRDNIGERRTGFLPTLLENLGEQIKEQVDPDQVLETMIELVQNVVDQEPEQPNEPEF